MPERVKVNMCCHSETGNARFSAKVGDIVLIRTESGYGERQVAEIGPDGIVAVVDLSVPEPKRISVTSNDIVALMLD